MSRRAPVWWPAGTPVGVTRRQALAQLARIGLRVGGALAVAVSLTATAASAPTEYQVKAAFLFNFVKFTEWPAAAFPDASAPLVIGVLGNDPFGRTLDELVQGESINGRSMIIKRFPAGSDPADCHVLFVTRSEKDRLSSLLKALKKKPCLTISDLDRFCQQGGTINLVLSASGTVKPEISPDAARAAGVQISSRLLNLPMVRLVKAER
jgi:hypothetical protein